GRNRRSRCAGGCGNRRSTRGSPGTSTPCWPAPTARRATWSGPQCTTTTPTTSWAPSATGSGASLPDAGRRVGSARGGGAPGHRHPVRARAGVEDGVGGELDAVGDARRVEHEDVAVAFAVEGQAGDLDPGDADAGASLGPDRGGIVDRVVWLGELELEMKPGRCRREAIGQLLLQVIGIARRGLVVADRRVAVVGNEVPARMAGRPVGGDELEGVAAVVGQ